MLINTLKNTLNETEFMEILVAEKSQLHIDAITTWLQKEKRSFQILGTNCYRESMEIYSIRDIAVIVLGEDIHPLGQTQWFNDLMKVKATRATLFIFIISGNRIPTVQGSNEPLFIIHVNDAMPFFTNFDLTKALNNTYFSPFLMSRVGLIPSKYNPLIGLSQTERMIAGFVAQNLNNDEISDHLSISPHTVSTHRKNVRQKLNITGGKNALLEFLTPYTLWLIGIIR
jgi:DNA-binding CsgD family transcriptional regulator